MKTPTQLQLQLHLSFHRHSIKKYAAPYETDVMTHLLQLQDRQPRKHHADKLHVVCNIAPSVAHHKHSRCLNNVDTSRQTCKCNLVVGPVLCGDRLEWKDPSL